MTEERYHVTEERYHMTEERGMEMSCDSQEAWRCDRIKGGQPASPHSST